MRSNEWMGVIGCHYINLGLQNCQSAGFNVERDMNWPKSRGHFVKRSRRMRARSFLTTFVFEEFSCWCAFIL